MEANKETTVEEIWDKHFCKGDFFCHLDMDQIAIKDAMEEYANAKLHLLQQEYDKLKGENERLQKIVDQNRNLLCINAGVIEDYENRLFGIKELEHDYAALKAKADKMAASIETALADRNRSVPGGHISDESIHWLRVALSSYNSNTNAKNEINGRLPISPAKGNFDKNKHQ